MTDRKMTFYNHFGGILMAWFFVLLEMFCSRCIIDNLSWAIWKLDDALIQKYDLHWKFCKRDIYASKTRMGFCK